MGKSTQLSFSIYKQHDLVPFDIVHSDVWMSPILSVSGFRYYVLFTYNFSRYTWVFPMRRISKVFNIFKDFLAFVTTQFNRSIKIFRSNGGW